MRCDVDVVVAGGGPAGAIAAFLLAKAGRSVLLMERGPVNRNKACGHCLNARSLSMFDRVGLLPLVRDLAVGSTDRVVAHARATRPLRLSIATGDDERSGLVVPRDRLDESLREVAAAAGADVRHEATARLLAYDPESTTVRGIDRQCARDVSCRLLVAADGVGSAIARAARFADSHSAGRKYAFAFDRPPDRSTLVAIESGCIDMFLTDGGYLGAVRQDDGMIHMAVLVSSGAPRSPVEFVRTAARLHDRLRALGLHEARQEDLLNFSAVGPMPWRPHAIANASVVLLGDAAGYVEPFTGEGITWAIDSAMLLSEVVAQQRQCWNASAAEEYSSRWRDRVQRRQRLCRTVAAVLERPIASRWMLRLGRAAPVITRRVLRQVVAA